MLLLQMKMLFQIPQ